MRSFFLLAGTDIHARGVRAVGDRADVLSDDAAHIVVALNRALGLAVVDHAAAFVRAGDAADIVLAGDRTAERAAGNRAVVRMPVQQDPEEELLYIEENFCEIHWPFLLSHFGVNILSVTFLIVMSILFFIISSFVLPKLWNAGVNSSEQFVLEYQNEK